jgi:hypothetical protein
LAEPVFKNDIVIGRVGSLGFGFSSGNVGAVQIGIAKAGEPSQNRIFDNGF